MPIEHSSEWQLAKRQLSCLNAERSGVSYFNHVEEGVKILDLIDADMVVKQAFCLHPLLQSDDNLVKFWNLLENRSCNADAVALAMEYRWVANNGTRKKLRENSWNITLSVVPEVNQMLIADKIQNRKDFDLYQKSHPERDELDHYFRCWFLALGISVTQYQDIIAQL